MTAIPKPVTTRSEDYRRWVEGLPCLTCLNALCEQTHAHHVPEDGKGAERLKTDDDRVIPLCGICHAEAHQIGKHTFARKHGLDYETIIARLNEIYAHWKGGAP